MEYQDPLIAWAIKNAKELGLIITQQIWVNRLKLATDIELHSFSCEVNINGLKVKGFGKDKKQDIAIKKSIIEAIERVLIHEYNLETSNGVAGHVIFDLAKKNAINELIERDLFLCHFLTKIPYQEISDELIKPELKKIQYFLEKHKIKISLFYLGEVGCLGLLDGQYADRSFGYIVSSSYSESIESAIENTVFNLTQSGFYRLNENNDLSDQMPLSIEDFKCIKHPNFKHHGLLALHQDYVNSISFLFENKKNEIQDRDQNQNQNQKYHLGRPFNRDTIVCNNLVSSYAVLKNIPAHFVQAQSKQAQNLFLGFPIEESVNLDRLSQFSNKVHNIQSIFNKPHPMD